MKKKKLLKRIAELNEQLEDQKKLSQLLYSDIGILINKPNSMDAIEAQFRHKISKRFDRYMVFIPSESKGLGLSALIKSK